MRLLTTGELASLFSVSKYTIRHYIDIELLVPKQKKENGYCLFDEENIYKLYQIIVLKKIGYPIQTIKTILKEKELIHYFTEAQTSLQKQIDELKATKNTVNLIIQAQENYPLDETIFFDKPNRYFKEIPEIAIENNTVNLLKASELQLSNLDDIYYLTKKNRINIPCLKCEEKESDHFFSEGTYACKNFIVKDESCIERNINLFLSDKLLNLNGPTQNDFLLYENIYCSLAYTDLTVFSIEVKL